MQRSGTAGSGGRGASGGTGRSGRAGGPGVSGKVVQAGVAIELARRAGRVVRSTEVQQRARELMPAANRLPASAVRAVREARGHGHRVYLCTVLHYFVY